MIKYKNKGFKTNDKLNNDQTWIKKSMFLVFCKKNQFLNLCKNKKKYWSVIFWLSWLLLLMCSAELFPNRQLFNNRWHCYTELISVSPEKDKANWAQTIFGDSITLSLNEGGFVDLWQVAALPSYVDYFDLGIILRCT